MSDKGRQHGKIKLSYKSICYILSRKNHSSNRLNYVINQLVIQYLPGRVVNEINRINRVRSHLESIGSGLILYQVQFMET